MLNDLDCGIISDMRHVAIALAAIACVAAGPATMPSAPQGYPALQTAMGRLKTENDTLKAENKKLADRVAALESQLQKLSSAAAGPVNVTLGDDLQTGMTFDDVKTATGNDKPIKDGESVAGITYRFAVVLKSGQAAPNKPLFNSPAVWLCTFDKASKKLVLFGRL